SSIRSSTSRCLIPALTSRITPRRCFSPAFIAAFMSLVSCCLRVMWGGRRGLWEGWAPEVDPRIGRLPRWRQTQKAGDACACRLPAKRRGSVQALALGDVARHAACLALHRGGRLALALLGRLLVELALAGLGQHASLLAGALEATQGKLERLVFADFDAGHRDLWLSGKSGPDGRSLRRDSHVPTWQAGGAAYDSRSPCNGATGAQIPRMKVLGIESSCDETGVAVYDTGHAAGPDAGPGQPGLLAHAVYSQIALHAEYGGVVPELASRDHVRKLLPLIRQTLAEAGLGVDEIDGVAYTAGPGLVGALLVGAGVARSLAWALEVPAVGVHHMEGHLLAPLMEDDPPQPPFVALLVSGGHTQLI